MANLIEEHGLIFASLVEHFGEDFDLDEAKRYQEDGYRVRMTGSKISWWNSSKTVTAMFSKGCRNSFAITSTTRGLLKIWN